MKQFIAQHLKAIALIVVFLAFSVTFYFLSPEAILNAIGVENAYLLMFLLAFAGGITTFSGIPFHIILIALAGGGLNPWLLGLLATGGVMLGDSTSYLLGRKGSELLSSRMLYVLEKLRAVEQRSPRLFPAVFFLYGALVPFSNDVVVIPAGLLGHPFWRTMVPLGLGTLVFNLGLALIAAYATNLLAVFL